MFPERCDPAVFGRPMYAVLGKAKITHNRHTDTFGNIVGNVRTFEATGMGSCLLTNHGDNVGDLYEPGSEIVTYTSPEDCVEKARYLLSHDKERRAIAKAGQTRTLGEHTTRHRCEQIHAIIAAAL